tara:strand:+ start:3418 stop:3867 length:450 start_codon:yes stop_codon:yes gene_type:complete
MDEKKITKLEFLLSLEDHIICQRFFNVRGYNPNNIRSLDLYEIIEDIQIDVQHSLKLKAIDYLLDNYNRYTHTVNLSDQDRNPQIKENFNIYLKINNELITHRIFPAWIYPAKIRYTVDIRPFVPSFLRELSDVLSAKKVRRKYLETTL